MSRQSAEPDLFENHEGLPEEIRKLVMDFSVILESAEIDAYEACSEFLTEAQELGYTFEYGLDGIPYGLRLAFEDELTQQGPSPG